MRYKSKKIKYSSNIKCYRYKSVQKSFNNDILVDYSPEWRILKGMNMKDLRSLKAAVGLMIYEKRKARGWSQQQLADATDLKRTTISNIEYGRQSISVEQLCAIAQMLGAEPDILLRRALTSLLPKDRQQKVKVVVASNESDKIVRQRVLEALK